MYNLKDINSETLLAGFLRCDVGDIPILRQRKTGIRRLYIKKKNPKNGYRVVYEVRDSLLQNCLKCLQTELSRLYCPPEYISGFTHGRNIAYNAKFHLNKKYVLNIDICNFFENIQYTSIVSAFEKLGLNNSFSVILADIVTYYKTLVAGYNTSPLIANMVCENMDAEIKALCDSYNITYTRYADDLSFSGDTVECIDSIKSILHKYGFNINERKTRIYKKGGPQFVTGLTVVDSQQPRIPRKIKKGLRADIYYIKQWGFTSYVEYKYNIESTDLYLLDYIKHQESCRIMGWLNYINGIEPVFSKKYITEIESIKKQDLHYFENAYEYVEGKQYG